MHFTYVHFRKTVVEYIESKKRGGSHGSST
jgi:hypothetical protein